MDTKKEKESFFFAMRTLQIYPLNSLPIYHTAVLAIVITLCITFLVPIYLITGNSYLLTIFLHRLHL